MTSIGRFFVNQRMSVKLAATSALGVALVATIILMQMRSDANVAQSNERAFRQEIIARNMAESKASVRGMQVGLRDYRLALSADDMKKATEYFAARKTSAVRYTDEALNMVERPEIKDKIARQKLRIEEYAAVVAQIAEIKSESLIMAALGALASAEKLAAFDEKMQRITRERALPIAGQLGQEVDDIINSTRERGDQLAVESKQAMADAEHLSLAFGATLVLLLIGNLVFLLMTVARPMRALTVSMLDLAKGNFEVVLPGLGRKDEVGDIAGAVEQFKVVAAEKARAQADAKAEQDKLAAEQRRGDMQRLANDFESAVGGIIHTVSSASTELEAAAGTLTRTAESTQSLTTRVASASEEASTNVQSVASATEEMASSVSEISRQVQESARIASEAVSHARQTDERINSLSEAASRIGDVVDLINSIAGQTNLLALNATIEAARAGEAGRGFAVVASEVKALAEQTAKATSEISQQIGGIQAATNDSVTAIKEIGAIIVRISEISSTIASAIEEQGAATQEIARNVQSAASGTSEVASGISEVERGASETGSASSQVLTAAQELSGESNRLRLEVGKFLETVRAA